MLTDLKYTRDFSRSKALDYCYQQENMILTQVYGIFKKEGGLKYGGKYSQYA